MARTYSSILAAQEAQVSGYPVYDRGTKIRVENLGPVTLMGDAAHPEPIQRTGANQALLDALAAGSPAYTGDTDPNLNGRSWGEEKCIN
jgi:2-polyprenyl-6-methoxyphenol hydroxylase-like FAD-dependent oxidoreductase